MTDTVDELFDEYEEETPPAGRQEKNPVAAQRKHIKELEAKLKAYDDEVPSLREFKTKYDADQRSVGVKALFQELEVPEKAVKFFMLENPEGEFTKETIATWAVENEFATEDQFTGKEKTDKGYTPTTHGEGHIPGAKTYTRKEFEKLLSSGNEADTRTANKAIAEGRVDLIRED